MNYLETEIKLYVPDLNAVIQRLESIGGKLVHPRVFEYNVRYENAEKTLTPSGIVIRLRRDAVTRLTFKSPGSVAGDAIRTRFEAEVEVSDFDTMETILGQLGYYPYMIYEKYRTTYELEGESGSAEIVFDEMPYGHFMEIEGDPKAIESMITRLELNDALRCKDSYAALFDLVRRNLDLNFQDLTFDNFKDIDVPQAAFCGPEE
jgi:adenylate cyclase, class 2